MDELKNEKIKKVEENKRNYFTPKFKRFINYLIDVGIFYIIIQIIFRKPVRETVFSPVYAVLIGMGFYLIYMFIMEMLWGASLGKFITKTKVVTFENDKPKLKHIILRTLGRFIPLNGIVTLFSGKSLHERISKTRTIELKRLN